MVFYFTASWCSPCKMFRPILQQVQSELGINVNIVDVDAQKDLAQKYGITSVPTIIIESNGSIVYRNSGIVSKPQLTQVLSQFR
jgi:thioredoxin 1